VSHHHASSCARAEGRNPGITVHAVSCNRLYAQLLEKIVWFMMDNTQEIFRATRLQSIGKYLERIADHATNIAEMVVFIVRGEETRHADHESVH
jgi:phosphate uptake regulator